jgi:hypothetical protein
VQLSDEAERKLADQRMKEWSKDQEEYTERQFQEIEQKKKELKTQAEGAAREKAEIERQNQEAREKIEAEQHKKEEKIIRKAKVEKYWDEVERQQTIERKAEAVKRCQELEEARAALSQKKTSEIEALEREEQA